MLRHGINGYMYCNMPTLSFTQGETVSVLRVVCSTRPVRRGSKPRGTGGLAAVDKQARREAAGHNRAQQRPWR